MHQGFPGLLGLKQSPQAWHYNFHTDWTVHTPSKVTISDEKGLCRIGWGLKSMQLVLCRKGKATITEELTWNASAVELGKAKVVQLDDEVPGLLIPEGVHQDAARPQ